MLLLLFFDFPSISEYYFVFLSPRFVFANGMLQIDFISKYSAFVTIKKQ
jgi:hypothetical protein